MGAQFRGSHCFAVNRESAFAKAMAYKASIMLPEMEPKAAIDKSESRRRRSAKPEQCPTPSCLSLLATHHFLLAFSSINYITSINISTITQSIAYRFPVNISTYQPFNNYTSLPRKPPLFPLVNSLTCQLVNYSTPLYFNFLYFC